MMPFRPMLVRRGTDPLGRARLGVVLLALGALGLEGAVPRVRAEPAGPPILLLEVEGTVEFRARGATNWAVAKVNQVLHVGDGLRTGERSRLAVRLGGSVIRKSELTTIEIEPPAAGTEEPVLDIKRGLLYFFSRDKPRALRLRTPHAAGAIRGTEFHVAVGADGGTVLTVIDGEVELGNAAGTVRLANGEQGKVEPGRAPTQTAVLSADSSKLIQWCLYYPGVLDLRELHFHVEEVSALDASLRAYGQGDLLRALGHYPARHQPASADGQLYLAGLLLSVGQAEAAQALIADLGRLATDPPACGAALAETLQTLIAAVRLQSRPTGPVSPGSPSLASRWLGESYYLQSRRDLKGALAAGRKAVEISPDFGFGWARVAELEFSFGRVPQAREALARSLRLAPRNAQALALRGFLLSAENAWAAAQAAFEEAMAVDGALGNAWLGRGLVRIRRGERAAGRADLQTAAALEPQRGLLRSYLGKAFFEEEDLAHADRELRRAKGLDAEDPTAWLYAALLARQEHRGNEAIQDLERAQELNANRSVFRSELLLDQDRAVRGANLAAIYREAGLTEVSVREAARAVNADYANASAHLLLASSYDALRDPRQVNLRYETLWLSELLLAQLLAPVGAGSLSQSISQQEYSRLFEGDRFGVSTGTEYLGRGDWQTYGSQYGIFGRSSYALDAAYRSQRGDRPNEDLEQHTLYATFKGQWTAQDSLFFQTFQAERESGDVRQYYDPRSASPTLRFAERQEPNVLVGYHRAWTPGSHTLVLVARLADEVELREPMAPVLTLGRSAAGTVTSANLTPFGRPFAQDYRSALEAYSTELQHVWQGERRSLVAGGRFQTGQADTISKIAWDPTGLPLALFDTLVPADSLVGQANTTHLERLSVYGYGQWQVALPLRLVAGVSYDRLDFPRNIDLPPISHGQRTEDQVSPKAGFIWELTPATHLRGTYTRSLGGLYYDTSVRLEPVQVAGFNQAFRSAIPESVAGLVPGARFETLGLGLDHRFPTATYVGIEGELLDSHGSRLRGVLDFPQPPATPGAIQETLEYRERTLTLTVNQLLGSEWALGARYRVSAARLSDQVGEVPTTLYAKAGIEPLRRGILHQWQMYVSFNHRSGFFAQAESAWLAQRNQASLSNRPGDDFWQIHSFVGYRFPHRRAELSVGVLNLTDRDYQLDPLNLHPELPRGRTVAARFKLDF